MDKHVQVFRSFEEAERADLDFYAALTRRQCVDLLLEIIAMHTETPGDIAAGWRPILASLNSHAVEFIVVGDYAVAFHGHPRFTDGIDIMVRPTRDNAGRVMLALADAGFTSTDTLNPGVSEEAFTRPNIAMHLGAAPHRIGLFTDIAGVGFDEAWAGREAGDISGLPLTFLGYDALLTHKMTTGRTQDLADAERLRAIAARRHTPG